MASARLVLTRIDGEAAVAARGVAPVAGLKGLSAVEAAEDAADVSAVEQELPFHRVDTDGLGPLAAFAAGSIPGVEYGFGHQRHRPPLLRRGGGRRRGCRPGNAHATADDEDLGQHRQKSGCGEKATVCSHGHLPFSLSIPAYAEQDAAFLPVIRRISSTEPAASLNTRALTIVDRSVALRAPCLYPLIPLRVMPPTM
jgi:hypothetical protein